MTTVSIKQVEESRLGQLARALGLNISFRDAFYIVYSDYPSINTIGHILNSGYEIDEDMHIILIKEFNKLKKGG